MSDGVWGFATDLEIIYPKFAHLLILIDQKWTVAQISRKNTALESKYVWWKWSS